MKNKKGFTLIEIIGAVIILGIIAIFAVVTYTNSLKGFREDYYKETERTLENSGKEFFNDYRNYRPDMVLGAQKVLLKTLVSGNYVSDVKDYDGNKCDYENSYVLIVKENKNDYSYHACLICEDSKYSLRDKIYCDSSWLDSNMISYTLGNLDDIYIYKGTGRDELKDKLLLSLSIIRVNYNNEVIGRVEDEEIEGLPQILPNNIDVVDTNTIGIYHVEYNYNDIVDTRNVIVYENDAPDVNIIYRKGEETGAYPKSGMWVQEVTISLESPDSSSTEIDKFQWYKDSRWIDFCDATNNKCAITYNSDINEEIEFRSINKDGKISKISDKYLIKIDTTKPRCTLRKTGEANDISWYTREDKVEFDIKEDQLSSDINAVSGIKIERIIKEDTSSTIEETYTGYVEDEAGNSNTCSISFETDGIPPTCTIEITKNEDPNGVDTSVICNDVGSGCVTDGNPTGDVNLKVTKTYTVRDNMGNTGTCTVNVNSVTQKSTRTVTTSQGECKRGERKKTCRPCGSNAGDCEICEYGEFKCYEYATNYNYGPWGAYTDVSSCTGNTTTQCRTIYRGTVN